MLGQSAFSYMAGFFAISLSNNSRTLGTVVEVSNQIMQLVLILVVFYERTPFKSVCQYLQTCSTSLRYRLDLCCGIKNGHLDNDALAISHLGEPLLALSPVQGTEYELELHPKRVPAPK